MKLVLVGDAPFAQIAYEYFTADSEYEIVGFAVESEFLTDRRLFSLPVIPIERIEEEFPPDEYHAFVAIAYNTMNRVRARLYRELKEKGYDVPTYISSEAFVWDNVEVGENCFVFEGNTLQPWVELGNNVVLWSGNHVGHHSTIGDHTFVASHAVISGFVDVGEYCFIGVNATVANNVSIADNCLVGAAANILDDTKENAVYGARPTEPTEYSAFDYFGVK